MLAEVLAGGPRRQIPPGLEAQVLGPAAGQGHGAQGGIDDLRAAGPRRRELLQRHRSAEIRGRGERLGRLARPGDVRRLLAHHASDRGKAEELPGLVRPLRLPDGRQRDHEILRGRHQVHPAEVLKAAYELVLQIHAELFLDLEAIGPANGLGELQDLWVGNQVRQAPDAGVGHERRTRHAQRLCNEQPMWCHWIVQHRLHPELPAPGDDVVAHDQRARQRPHGVHPERGVAPIASVLGSASLQIEVGRVVLDEGLHDGAGFPGGAAHLLARGEEVVDPAAAAHQLHH
mmetsp:Transcript_91179/g.178469  ORF Transcript_91179/g.178469 Transcript_91179/m.178469 type:complete len:288 (+) Transcript_91179:580-1443(+)